MAVRTAYVGTQSVGDVLTSANFTKLPGGWIGYAEVTASQGSITTVTDLTSLTVTVTVGSSRKIRVTGLAHFSSSVAADQVGLYITNGSDTVLSQGLADIRVTGRSYTVVTQYVTNPSSGSNTYKLRALRAAGTGNVQMDAAATAPAFIVVEDLGPSS